MQTHTHTHAHTQRQTHTQTHTCTLTPSSLCMPWLFRMRPDSYSSSPPNMLSKMLPLPLPLPPSLPSSWVFSVCVLAACCWAACRCFVSWVWRCLWICIGRTHSMLAATILCAWNNLLCVLDVEVLVNVHRENTQYACGKNFCVHETICLVSWVWRCLWMCSGRTHNMLVTTILCAWNNLLGVLSVEVLVNVQRQRARWEIYWYTFDTMAAIWVNQKTLEFQILISTISCLCYSRDDNAHIRMYLNARENWRVHENGDEAVCNKPLCQTPNSYSK
jgi:hypothetical protein